MIVPKPGAPASAHFVPAPNARASDEIEAHTGMFAGKTNDGYYALGLATAGLVREAVMAGRGVYDEGAPPEENKEEGM